jgi:hypothetical protein
VGREDGGRAHEYGWQRVPLDALRVFTEELRRREPRVDEIRPQGVGGGFEVELLIRRNSGVAASIEPQDRILDRARVRAPDRDTAVRIQIGDGQERREARQEIPT